MNSTVSSPASWIMLVFRTLAFISIQALFALGFRLSHGGQSWQQAADFWPFVVVITNLLCLSILVRLFKRQGRRYWHIFKIEKSYLKNDLLVMLLVMLASTLLSMLPNMLLAQALFGDPQAALDFMLRPLPLWAALASLLLFPLTQGLAEIPTYFSYVMPAFRQRGMPAWLAVGLPAVFLSVQHIGIPFILHPRYFLLRALMFLPFAIFLGLLMHWRPRLLPYLAIMHVLMDASMAVMLLGVAY